jgi:hypothetical protein
VESGSRPIVERAMQAICYARVPGAVIDIVTCYPGPPVGLSADSVVFPVSDYQGRNGRRRLLRELRSRGYTSAGIVCSDEPIMTKWKWWAAVRLPVKVFVVNENCDWFWIDRAHWRTIVRFVSFRAGLAGGDAAGSIGRFLAFPFMLLYLLAFAAWVHLRRLVRIGLRRESHG